MLTRSKGNRHSFHNVEEQGLTIFLFTLAWIDVIHFFWLDYHSYFEPQEFSSFYIELSILDYHSSIWAAIMLLSALAIFLFRNSPLPYLGIALCMLLFLNDRLAFHHDIYLSFVVHSLMALYFIGKFRGVELLENNSIYSLKWLMLISYFFSSFQKINYSFLSGDVMKGLYASSNPGDLGYPVIQLIDHPSLLLPSSIGAVLIEAAIPILFIFKLGDKGANFSIAIVLALILHGSIIFLFLRGAIFNLLLPSIGIIFCYQKWEPKYGAQGWILPVVYLSYFVGSLVVFLKFSIL